MKRKRKAERDKWADKRQKLDNDGNGQSTLALLRYYYPKVVTLRHYLASTLSKSKKRQRKVLHYGLDGDSRSAADSDAAVAKLLDATVIGTSRQTDILDFEAIGKDITLFTQQVSEPTATISPTQGALKQSEIVDFTIWLIFRRHLGFHNPTHLLSHGFQKYAKEQNNDAELLDCPAIPGVWSSCHNPHVEILKGHPWSFLPSLLGRGAERIIGDLLLHCGVFQQVDDSGNLSQLSGIPLNDLKGLRTTLPTSLPAHNEQLEKNEHVSPDGVIQGRGHSDVRFVRQRMLYAKPGPTAKGKSRLGLGDMHVFNRYADTDKGQQTIHTLKYMFPRQFDLRNVFTSKVDRNQTAHLFEDYTDREQEINRLDCQWRQNKITNDATLLTSQRPLPKRLRGQVLNLVRTVRKRHSRCAYQSMLNFYCRRPSQSDPESSIAQASTPAEVSALCKAIISKVFPGDFWGRGEARSHNIRTLLRMVDKFVRLRRYEFLSLHDVLQDLKITPIPWLAPENMIVGAKLSRTDFAKRKELMAELLYYLFDSFLIPLIRNNFYVTESGVHRNQLFFFRQDVWQTISKPALDSLKTNMLEPWKTSDMQRELAKRQLGVSKVRMLPKERGMRPIINLKRRVQKQGGVALGKSANRILTPTFSILNYEKATHADMLASALFSVEDMYPRLQAFRTALEMQGVGNKPLYFAKVDVKACFDTIPQKRLLQLVGTIVQADEYHIAKYKRAKLPGEHKDDIPGFGAKPLWKYDITKATTDEGGVDFASEVEADTAEGRTRTVYVKGNFQRSESRKAVLKLLEEHVESNLIKIGNRFYRQKEGIPQGSIVSSLLCSYFYAELEREVLGFVHEGESMVLRLIDDFLVISRKQEVAERFLRTMHEGLPSFGVEIKAEKSRANFDIEIDGRKIPRLPLETHFPYCGNKINTITLNLSKDKERRMQSNMQDSTTVEYSRVPGQTFYRKTLDALKRQMQAMLLSTRYNSLSTVLANLHHAFTEVAQKTYYYIRSLPTNKQPSSKLVIKAVDDLIKLACMLMKRRKQTSKDILPYECCVKNAQARWLACTAFHEVFRRRQTKHVNLLFWLKCQLALPSLKAQRNSLGAIVTEFGEK